jgi:hypothetical protein
LRGAAGVVEMCVLAKQSPYQCPAAERSIICCNREANVVICSREPRFLRLADFQGV